MTTKPWHRETLAKPVMDPDNDEDREALRGHLIGVREGAVGGAGGGGGGGSGSLSVTGGPRNWHLWASDVRIATWE